jgi:hypothetical protein
VGPLGLAQRFLALQSINPANDILLREYAETPPAEVQKALREAQLWLLRTGGTPPFSLTMISGQLPPGLSLDSSTGHLAGTPAVLGNPTVIAGVGVTHLRYPVRNA